jgi:hypothetical protein
MHPYFYQGCTVDTDALPDLIDFLDQFLGNIKGDADLLSVDILGGD